MRYYQATAQTMDGQPALAFCEVEDWDDAKNQFRHGFYRGFVASVPEVDCIVRFDLRTMREIARGDLPI